MKTKRIAFQTVNMYRRVDLDGFLTRPTFPGILGASKSPALSRNNQPTLEASRKPPGHRPPSLYGTFTGRHGTVQRTNSQRRPPVQRGEKTSLLPGINMNCTSMVIDSVNYNINYSSLHLSNLYQSCRASITSGRRLGLKSTQLSKPCFSSGAQALQSRFQDAQKTLHAFSKVSNVRVTMQYLGIGGPEKNELVTPRDELRMFQQICGGENLCVYQGYLCPGEHFQFLSKRHPTFPFSASIYINGIISARISTCCEYKYHVGFQQGKHGCFRVLALSGGKPCYRCIKVHNQKNYRKKHERGHQERPPSDGLLKESDVKGEGSPAFAQGLESGKNELSPTAESCHARFKSEDTKSLSHQGGNHVDETSSKGLKTDEKQQKLNEKLPNEKGGRVTRTNVRKRLKKNRMPREDSDSEQENCLSKKDGHFRRSAHRTKARMMQKDHEHNSTAISLAQSYLERGSATTAVCRSAPPAKKQEQSPDLSSANSGDVYSEDPVYNKAHIAMTCAVNNKIHPPTIRDTKGDALTLHIRSKNAESSCGAIRSHTSIINLISQEAPPSISERGCSVQEKLATVLKPTDDVRSNVELSDSSDTSDVAGKELLMPARKAQVRPEFGDIVDRKNLLERTQPVYVEKAESNGAALKNQIADLMEVLRECDEVEQLVLRNTGMTGDLLELLTRAMIETQSDVETINLNLNNLGPAAAHDIVQLLQAKPSLKRLLLFGNQMGDEGITALMNGLSELLTKDAPQASPSTTETPPELTQQKSLNLLELDLGGNKLTCKGLRSVASLLRMNPPIQHLGLAQNNIERLEGWVEFFDSMKSNTIVTHMLLYENNLGNEGTKILANMLQVNQSLCKIDLDNNNIGEDGAAAIIESLQATTHSFLVQVSLDENQISLEMQDKINELLTQNF